MSELAFNLNGEPFEVPPAASGWRVRKFKSKGAPEVVYGREGVPLVLPIDADMEDLRREARTEGRYRLDAVDDTNRLIAGAPPAYVCIQSSDPTPAPAPPVEVPEALKRREAVLPAPDAAVIEAMRVNSAGFIDAMKVTADLARAVIERFPTMLESASVLIRAADAAGMPARPLRPFEVVEIDDEEDADEPAPEAPPSPAKAGGLGGFLERLLDAVAPDVVRAVLSGKLQVPGGLGAVLDLRRPSADAVVEVAPTSARVNEPAPGRRVPAPASSRVRPGSAGPYPAARPAASPIATPPERAERSHMAPVPVPTAATADIPEGLPTLDAADLAHFGQILGALDQREQLYAQALASELSPDELRAWIAELKALSVPDAVAKIRSVLGVPGDAQVHGSAIGGAS